MSEPQGANYFWTIYAEDMMQFAKEALCFTRGMDQSEFLNDLRTYRATLKTIEMVGEAAAKVPTSVRLSHPHIPWKGIIGVRNRIAHFYSGIDDDIIWNIIQIEIPALIPQLRKLLEDFQQEQD